MLINSGNLDALFKGFDTSFNKGLGEAPSQLGRFAMTVPSSARDNTYAWLGQIPRMREWLGDRVIHGLGAHGYTVLNRKFELSLDVARDDIEDDTYGVFGPLFEEMGRSSRQHPDELVFDLLKAGFQSKCYDGQYFFDTDHPVKDENGDEQAVSNMEAGSGPAWYLLDTSRAIKPLLFQKRTDYVLTKLDNESDANVFMRDRFVYGVRARCNAGFALWQLAYGSKQALTPDRYKAARAGMMSLRGDTGKLLGVTPNLLMVPPALEEEGRLILNAERDADDNSNVWKGTADLIVSPWLAD